MKEEPKAGGAEAQTGQAGASLPAPAWAQPTPQPATAGAEAKAPAKEESKKEEPAEKKPEEKKVEVASEAKAEVKKEEPEHKAEAKEEVKKEEAKKDEIKKEEAKKEEIKKEETKKEESATAPAPISAPVPVPAPVSKPEEKAAVPALAAETVKKPEESKKEPEALAPEKQEPWANDDDEEDKDDDNVVQEEAPKERCGLLEKLMSLLKSEKEVNPVLAGYFCKVMQVIIEKRKLDLLEYIFRYREHIDNVLHHCYNRSIADVLSKILSNEDKFITGTTGEEFAEEKKAILERMVSKMEPTNKLEDITNNCFILCNLVDTKQQLGFFLNPDVLKKIYQIGASGHPMSLRASLTFFMTVMRTKTSNSSPAPADIFGMGNTPQEPKKDEEIDLTLLTQLSAEYMSKFKAYLERENAVTIDGRAQVDPEARHTVWRADHSAGI
ncbi:MAG: hypothetical protein P4L10_17380 [Acidobacteriaceae bacterium]|nr:hypothetical protein [Acidobacteriaceae bacterium]